MKYSKGGNSSNAFFLMTKQHKEQSNSNSVAAAELLNKLTQTKKTLN